MSRTKRGGKAPGYEYWSRRPGNRHGASPGAVTKDITHRAERQQNKRDALRATQRDE